MVTNKTKRIMQDKVFNKEPYKERRQELRNNCTDAEQALWQRLKGKQLGVKFRRQHGIGNYIVDFYCPSEKLAIELDGSQHYEADAVVADILTCLPSIKRETLNNDLQKTLTKHGLSLCEYYAMTCPEYKIYCDPKSASIETALLVSTEEFTADDYLSAILEMINRGLLKLAEQDYQETISNIPKPEVLYLQKGDVVFTEKGYFLHRKLLQELYGDELILNRDAFTLEDETKQSVTYYAKTKQLCDEWLFDLQQKTLEPTLEGYLGFTAEIVRIDEPQKIGQWQPDQFMVHDTGYSCSVYYKKIELPSFTIESLNLEADVLCLEPIFISGSFHGNEFSFYDVASWRPESGSDKLTDECAIFEWYFHISDEPKITTVIPENAHLTGEPPTEKGYVVPHYKFELNEDDERSNMLTLEQAKAVLKNCCQQYLNQNSTHTET